MESAHIHQKTYDQGLESLSFPIDVHNLPLRAEQLRTRVNMYPPLVFSQMVLQPLFVWMFWEHADHTLLLFWLGCFYVTHLFELANWHTHRGKLGNVQECRDLHLHFTFFALAAGILWGVAALLFFPADIGYQGLMICIMLGLVAGAVTMNPVHPPSLYTYVLGIMLPLIVRVAAIGDTIHMILTLMLLVFMVVVVSAGRGLNRTFMLSITQRFENVDLLQELTRRKAEVEDARRDLERANKILNEHGMQLERIVHDRTSELEWRTHENELIKDTTILALSSLAETRDNETGNHIRRTQNYIHLLARQLKGHPRFSHFLTEENILLLYKVAPLHDIGKVGIPDAILHKPGKLSDDEFEIMKMHAELGGNAIAAAMDERGGSGSPFLNIACQIALRHHEKWDGSGYPSGLRGDDIPIPARLMALADVYDALATRRVYKAAMGTDEVASIIVDGRGKHFDPDVVDAFLAIQQQFIEVAERFRD